MHMVFSLYQLTHMVCFSLYQLRWIDCQKAAWLIVKNPGTTIVKLEVMNWKVMTMHMAFFSLKWIDCQKSSYQHMVFSLYQIDCQKARIKLLTMHMDWLHLLKCNGFFSPKVDWLSKKVVKHCEARSNCQKELKLEVIKNWKKTIDHAYGFLSLCQLRWIDCQKAAWLIVKKPETYTLWS